MSQKFSRKTFQYFEQARRHKNNRKWFEKNQPLYKEEVREPFEHLILEIRRKLSTDLPRIVIEPRSISRPLRPSNRVAEGGGLIKDSSYVTLWEKKTSLFEWNPGIHIQIGAGKEDNFLGLGLYMISSRQMSLLRSKLVEDFEDIDALLSDRKLKKAWGGLLGEKFKRFPKGYNPEDPRTAYLWHKQFYLGRTLKRQEVVAKDFNKKVIRDLELALPFFQWVRSAVGTYSGLRSGEL